MKRRTLILSGLALGLTGAGTLARAQRAERLREIEQALAARVGVFARNIDTGAEFSHRAGERFAMCSTFKASLAALCLQRADRGELDLDERLSLNGVPLLPTSPVTSQQPPSGTLDIRTLCKSIVERSDNTAANLLLDRVGGPAAMTGFFRDIGDDVSRLDRTEMALNANTPNDPRDTTTPEAMARTVERLTLGTSVLNEGARQQLVAWMRNEQNAKNRIRAAVPGSWTVANKPGTTPNGAANDIAALWSPNGPRFVLAVYIDTRLDSVRPSVAAIREVAQIALRQIA